MFNELKKSLPNGLTCCNLISGCIAVSYALGGNAQTALLFIIIGAVFDFFDGFTARALKVSSPIGKELDSLADDITFGNSLYDAQAMRSARFIVGSSENLSLCCFCNGGFLGSPSRKIQS